MARLRIDGKRIRRLRQARRWSVRDLAKRTQQLSPPGITRSALGRVERGESRNVAAWRLEAIARVLELPVTDLLIGVPKIEQSTLAKLTTEDALRATSNLNEREIVFVADLVRYLEQRG